MLCSYYKTIKRDIKTGNTYFIVMPEEYVECADANGFVYCEGIIDIYIKGMPLVLEGSFDVDQVFNVTKDYIPRKETRGLELLLASIEPELSDNQIEKIIKNIDGDIFDFINSDNYEEKINKCIRIKDSSKKNKIIINIKDRLQALKNKEDFTQFLLALDIDMDKIECLYNKGVTEESFRANPYLNCIFANIPIEKAEYIAVKCFNINPYNIARLIGYTYEALIYNYNSGNTVIKIHELSELINQRINRYGIYKNKVNEAIVYFCVNEIKKYAVIKYINDEVYVYIKSVLLQEDSILSNMNRLNQNQLEICRNINIDTIQEHVGIVYNKGQRNVFNCLRKNGIKVVTGPPGSGKTAVIKGLIECFKANNKGKIKLAATTGRASQIMSRACAFEAQTVNMLIEVKPYDLGNAVYNKQNQLDADLVIVDEISMMDVQMFSLLLDAVQSNAILILVGDKDQLASVGSGNLLEDIIKSQKFETYYLTEIMRQTGIIPENAMLINSGFPLLKHDQSFMEFRFNKDEELIEELLDKYDHANSQILSPIKKHILGTENINNLIQAKLINKENKCVFYGNTCFYEGDKIIMNKTIYDKGFYNGETGIILKIDDDKMMIKLNKKEIELKREDYGYMDLAYAITIHKSQGGEEDNIYIILPTDAKMMLTRRMIYTAVTRAKKNVYIYSIKNAVANSINNIFEIKRKTLLKERLIQNV